LVKLCGVYDTLLADLDGLYHPLDPNDHLLLGLKGLMSQAELHQIQQRLHAGRLSKARRGKLFNHPPLGYVRDGEGLAIDPDQEVQHVVRTLFSEYERRGSVSGLLKCLVASGIRLPIRSQRREERGQLQWREPNRRTLLNVLKHPVYAGAYVWGRRVVDPKKQIPGRPNTGRKFVEPEASAVFLRDVCPAYITWEQYEANRRRLAENRQRAESLGSPRPGRSWLGGLVVCGRCDARMLVSYPGQGQLRYSCVRDAVDYGQPACQNLSGACLEALVAKQILRALEPASLELSLAAAAQCEQQRQEAERGWQLRLQRAREEAERAERQYQRVEPENRMVARSLESHWEERLRALRTWEEAYARFAREEPRGLSLADQAAIAALASDVPALWHAEQTRPEERQEIARLLLRQVVVTVSPNSQHVAVRLVWTGGGETSHTLIRPVQRYEQMEDCQKLMSRIEELRAAGQSSAEIAAQLNAEGFRPPRRRQTFNAAAIRQLYSRAGRLGRWPQPESALGEHEWWLTDFAAELSVPTGTLYTWIRQGWLQARRPPGPGGRWIIWADEEELTRLRALREVPRAQRRNADELKKPKGGKA
jgi:hypothetical protein